MRASATRPGYTVHLYDSEFPCEELEDPNPATLDMALILAKKLKRQGRYAADRETSIRRAGVIVARVLKTGEVKMEDPPKSKLR